MKIKSFLLTIVAVAFVCNPCFADPTDSLVNITRWETSDGGNGHTYAVLKMTLNWTEANALVPTLIRDSLPGYLATITSQQENDFIRDSLLLGLNDQPSILDQFYLGGIYVNQTWVWQPDEPVVYFNWNVGEPNNVGVETVMAIWGYHQSEGSDIAGLWNNTLPDDSFNRYAVQWSVVEWGEPDSSEFPVDTLVNIVTWPSSEGGNDHTYAILKVTLNWTEANALVPTFIRNSLPGYLATITSQQENNFILNSVIAGAGSQPSSPNQFYLGGVWVGGNWTWQSSEPFSFVNWAPTEPNNPGTETIIAIWGFGETDYRRPAGTWNDALPDNSSEPNAIQWSIIEWNKSELLNSIIEPNQIDAADSRPKDSAIVSIYLMDFLAPYTSNDIDQNSLLINGHLEPLSVTGSTSFGDAIKVDVLLHDFLKDYVIIWDTTTLDYSIEGKFVDGTPFKIVSSFQAIAKNTRGPNSHSNVSVTHLTIFINMMFRGLSVPRNTDAFDFDGSCDEPNVSDLRYLIDFLFRGGPPPVPGCTE